MPILSPSKRTNTRAKRSKIVSRPNVTLATPATLAEALIELNRRNHHKISRPMTTLRELFPNVISSTGNLQQIPAELTRDSRNVKRGSLFFAIEGARQNGNDFIQEAISRGAIAIVSEKPLDQNLPVATIQVASMKHALADAGRRFWGMPDKKLSLVGITGTKGKTTTTYIVQYLLQKAKLDCGMLSTVENLLGQRRAPASRTTQDALELASNFAQMRDAQCSHAVMEVSSHGLHQGRVLGLHYQVALFTNLSPEHMDYHPTMDDYYNAKKMLFTGEMGSRPEFSVINLDDPYGQRLYGEIHERNETVTYGHLPACDMQILDPKISSDHSQFVLKMGSRRYDVNLPLVGEHNIMNAVGALAVVYSLGLNIKHAVEALETFPGVPGRLERIAAGQPFEVLVDYAHTTDSLKQTLGALRKLPYNRIITVFGCGGNRDTQKRPLMTAAAMEQSDVTIATADNPRREKLSDIFDMMQKGVLPNRPIEFINDRRTAIARALKLAQPGDCVLVAGKGHEPYQEINDATIPFDDRQVCRQTLNEMGYGQP